MFEKSLLDQIEGRQWHNDTIKSHFPIKLVLKITKLILILQNYINNERHVFRTAQRTPIILLLTPLVKSSFVRYRKCLAIHLDDLIPNGNFPVLYSFGIISQVSSIILYHIRMYIEKNCETRILTTVFYCSFYRLTIVEPIQV